MFPSPVPICSITAQTPPVAILASVIYPAEGGTNGLAIRTSAGKPGDACLLASGWGSSGGTLGEQEIRSWFCWPVKAVGNSAS